MVDIGRAVSFPTSEQGWPLNLLIGGALSLFGFLVVPLFPVFGYFVQVLRSETTGSGELPGFDDWEQLFLDGLRLLGVQIAYALVPALVLFLGLTLGGIGVFSRLGGTSAGAAVEAVGILFIVAGLLGTLLSLYLLPAAVAHFAHRRRLKAAFDLRTVAGVGRSPDYLVAVVVAVFVGAVLGTLAGLLSFVVVGVFLAFYVQVVVYHLFGQGYAGATGSDREPDPEPDLTETVGWE